MKVLILSENTVGTDLYSGNTYRNIGATDVARRLDSRGIENTIIDWFSHWPKDLLQDSIITYLKDSKDPISGIDFLKGIMIISQNQIKLSSFKERFQENGEYAKLSEED